MRKKWESENGQDVAGRVKGLAGKGKVLWPQHMGIILSSVCIISMLERPPPALGTNHDCSAPAHAGSSKKFGFEQTQL